MSTAFQWTCGSCTYQNVVPDKTKSVVQCKMCGQTSQLQFGPPPATPPAPLPPSQPTPPQPQPPVRPPSAAKSEPKKESWTCSSCTYINTVGKACVICQAPRGAASQPTPQPVSTPPSSSYPGVAVPPGGVPGGWPQPMPPQPPQPTPQPPHMGVPGGAAVTIGPNGFPIYGAPQPQPTPPQPTPPQPTPQPVMTPPTSVPPAGSTIGMMQYMSPNGQMVMIPAPPGHPAHVPHVYASYAAMMGLPPAQPPQPTPQPQVVQQPPTPPTSVGGAPFNPYAPAGQPAGPIPSGFPPGAIPSAGGVPQGMVQPPVVGHITPPGSFGGVAVPGGVAPTPTLGGVPTPTPGATPSPQTPYLMDPSLVAAFAPPGHVTPPVSSPPLGPAAVAPGAGGMVVPPGGLYGAPAVPTPSSGEFGVDGKRGIPSPTSSPPLTLQGMGLPASHAAMRPTPAPLSNSGAASASSSASSAAASSAAANAFAGLAASALRDISAQGPPVTLTAEQKKQFVRQGYVIIPGVVPQSRISAALRAINQDLGRGVSRDEAIKAKSTTWCPSLMPMPVITNLFNATNAIHLVGSVLGQPCPAVTAGQIALRHPGTLCTDPVTFTPVPWWDKGWHIDGFHSKDNGIPKGQIRNFTCLVGVLLNDIPAEMCGNLAVFPRSHYVLQDYFRTNGFDKVKEGLDALPRLPLAKPVQITGHAGDLIICHYQLAHTIAPNVSPNVRYACYFRITAPSMKTQALPPIPDSVKDVDPHRPESMLKIWQDWPGVAPYLEPEGEREGISEWKDGGEGGQRPFYGDEVARVEDEKAAEDDRRRAVVQEQADKLFEAHKWLECQPIWTQLATEQPHDYVIQFKAGCVHTWSPREDAETLRQGEDFLQKAASLCPVYPNVYAVLAHNRLRQGRHKEAVAAVKQMLQCPYKEGEDRTIVDALKHARDSLVKLDQVGQLDAMLKQARTTYPHLGPQFDEIMVGVEGEQTWVQCKAWLDSPTKSFPHGEALFRKLVSLKPNDYWANWLLGGVLTWEGKCEKCIQGQPFIQEALNINPSLPHGYQLMAQNLMIQGKPQEAVAQVQAMLAQPLEDIATNDGHAQKIIEALNTVFKVLGKSSPEFQSLLTTAQSSYPSLLPRLAQFQ